MNDLISIIVTTYNWPEALSACLNSLITQQDSNYEIIVADDGSSNSTQLVIAEFEKLSPVTLIHIYQEDLGFRAGTIRNKAVAACQGKYLIFLDGDCVVFPNFVSRHRQLAENNYFVPGNRILLAANYTRIVLQQKIALNEQNTVFFIKNRLRGRINRVLPLLHFPWNSWRYRHPDRWKKAMTCNLGIWKNDFIAVNGFDEIFEGWGYEDSDLVVRLLHLGIKRKEGRFAAPVLHLWHKANDRSRHDDNYRQLLERLEDKNVIVAIKGVGQYLFKPS